jgi:hypothetical protein
MLVEKLEHATRNPQQSLLLLLQYSNPPGPVSISLWQTVIKYQSAIDLRKKWLHLFPGDLQDFLIGGSALEQFFYSAFP